MFKKKKPNRAKGRKSAKKNPEKNHLWTLNQQDVMVQ